MIEEAMELEQEAEGFVIDDDNKADWAVCRINEERAERDRLLDIAQNKIAEIELQMQEVMDRCDRRTSGLIALLSQYFDTVEHKKSKTQEKYQLLSGALVLKKGGLEYKVDNDLLVNWLQKNGKFEFIKAKASPDWASLKKLTKAAGDMAVLQETGDVIEGVSISEKADTFDIK